MVDSTYAFLTDAYHHLMWKCQDFNAFFIKSNIPHETFIAPSKNLLKADAFKKRRILPFSQLPNNIQQIVQHYHLKVPNQFSAAPLSNHCVSMSLHFLQRYQLNNRNIKQTAESLAQGADIDCASGTILYEGLSKANTDLEQNDDLLFKLRQVVAQTLGLRVEEEMTLKMPAQEMLTYIQNTLEQGEYLIRFPGHVVSLVKNSEEIYIYDCNQGTVALTPNSKQWFLNLLNHYRIHISETLSILPVHDQTVSDFSSIKGEVFSSQPDNIHLNFKPLKGKWEKVEFVFRGMTYDFIRDSKTNHIYNDNSENFIRFKLFLLIGRTMMDYTVRLVYHIGMVAFNLLALPFQACRNKEKFLECLAIIIRSTIDIFRSPIYGLISVGVAAYGVFNPYDGRRIYGVLERSLNRQTKKVSFQAKYYIAPCFTPINFNLEDLTQQNQTIETLKKYAIRSEEFNKKKFSTLFCGWTKQFRLC